MKKGGRMSKKPTRAEAIAYAKTTEIGEDCQAGEK